MSQKEAFKELDVEEFKIVATLDSHTSEICQEMDGKHFPMTDYEVGVTAPPFHVYCRSVTCPYFDDEFNLGEKRAARDENGKTYYVPSDMKYNEWKEKYVEGAADKEYNLAREVKDLGKFGAATVRKDINVDWDKTTIHAIDKLKSRNISKTDIENWIKTGVPVEQVKDYKYAFVTKFGVAVVDISGKLITAWSENDFDNNMIKIINILFGGE